MGSEKRISKIIAVDFDGTLVEDKYPDIGKTNQEVLEYCKAQQADGARIILWTNRFGNDLDPAVEWCEKNGLHLAAVNDNIPWVIEAFGGNPRKIFANEYIDDRASHKFIFRKTNSEDGDMNFWAEREIELAIAKSKEIEREKDDADYIIACYKSALKAFYCLADDGHSGMSIQITKSLLNRLINGQCLTPIEDTPDIWEQISFGRSDGSTHYQCKRMSSLFKDVDCNGNVTYSDTDRVQTFDIANPDIPYGSGFSTALVNKIFPIKMPYFPDEHKFKVYREEFQFEKGKDNYDTMAILNIITPDGEKIELNRYFKEDPEKGCFVNISKEEYEERKGMTTTNNEQ